MTKVRRTFKDSLFRMAFQGKEELLSLYNAVNDSSYTNADDLEITGKIATYVPVVIDGNSHVYFTLEGDKTVYDADLTNSEIVGIIAYKEGDSISMFYQDGDTTSNVTKIK